jgi:hypothetical protein
LSQNRFQGSPTAPSGALAEPAGVPVRVEFFTPRAPSIQLERILRIQGYSDLQRVRAEIRKASESMAALARTLSTPCVAYRRVPIVNIGDGLLEFDSGCQLRCRAFDRMFRGCIEAAPFVLTVGPKLDALVVELADQGELLDALLLETAGWLCIEDATRQFKIHLRQEELARGHRITSRMGPGYTYRVDNVMCTWPLEEQALLFGLFGAADLPVSLMHSCAMQPKMSRSGLFGLAPLNEGASNGSPTMSNKALHF